jgi:MerR family transcriptional regulator, heat shock protein HspR
VSNVTERERNETQAVDDPRDVGAMGEQERAVYVISVAAELAGVHPQTLRIYERKGLLSPKRTAGNTRRYSERDIQRLRAIQELTKQEGVNLAGVRMIMEMQAELERMRELAQELQQELAERLRRAHQDRAEIVPLRSSFHFPWDEQDSFGS